MTKNENPVEEAEQPIEQQPEAASTLVLLSVTLPMNAGVVKVGVPPATAIGDIRSHLIDSPEGNFNTCFYLAHKGVRLSDAMSVAEIPDFDLANASLTMVTDEFNDREVRVQIARLREVLTGFKSSTSSDFGIDVGICYLPTVSGDHDINPPQKPSEENADDTKKSVSHPFANYDFDLSHSADRVADLLPELAASDETPCLKSLTPSCWNPPPPHRRTAGDIMYLSVTTNEMAHVHITCSVTGFFVSRSTDKTFDPSLKSHAGPTLPHVLSHLSPSFKTNFAKLRQSTQTRHSHTYLLPSAQQTTPWLVQEPTVLPDPSRTLDVLVSTADTIDVLATRDWNNDFCLAALLPTTTATERMNRSQALHKTYSEFVDAAVHGVSALTANSLAGAMGDGQMYLHGGIFYSLAKDQFESYEHTGGAAAAHVGVSKDVDGVAKVDALSSGGEWVGVHTLATCVVDFKGVRVVAQAVVPGILNRQVGAAEVIVYGSMDAGKTVAVQEEFHGVLGGMAKALRLEEHAVVDGEGVQSRLYTPVDMKGIVGNDGRKYVLDLGRLTPADIGFLDGVDASEGLEEYPHRMALLRHELVDMYYDTEFAKFVKEKRDELAQTVEATEKVEDEEAEEAKKQEIDVSAFDIRFNTDAFLVSPEVEGAETEELKKQKESVRAISKFLQETVLPAIIIDLASNTTSVPLDGVQLTKYLHERGINMRYLGKIRETLDKLSPDSTFIKDLVLSEMISRASKAVLRELLREIPLHLASDCIAHFLNCLFVAKDSVLQAPHKPKSVSTEFAYLSLTPASLDARIRNEVSSRFRFANLPSHIVSTSRKVALLRSIALKLGFQMKSKAYAFSTTAPIFASADVLNLSPLAKYPEPKCAFADEVVEHAMYAIRAGDKQQGQDFMVEALHVYEQALGPVHAEASKIQQQLARLQHEFGNLELCKFYQRRALIVSERLNGFDDPETLQQYLNLGYFECVTRNFEVGFKYMDHATKLMQMHCGTLVHPELAAADAQIAMLLCDSKSDPTVGLQFLSRAISTYETLLGKDHDQTLRTQEMRVNILLQEGEFAEALICQEAVLEIQKAKFAGTEDEKEVAILTGSSRVVQFLKNRIQMVADEKAAKAAKIKAAAEAKKTAAATPPGPKKAKSKTSVARKSTPVAAEVPAAAAVNGDASASKGHLSIDELMNFIDGSGAKKGKKGKK
ncbi:Intracellular distribution of mitochondria [Podochytrium sp. JEL0797]|nr:Intracellular distribution of mitochondria [Podochytrium sp. JEL0797]